MRYRNKSRAAIWCDRERLERTAWSVFEIMFVVTKFIHGGITAALIDDLFGWMTGIERTYLIAENAKMYKNAKAFTAKLTINYRRLEERCVSGGMQGRSCGEAKEGMAGDEDLRSQGQCIG